jgi:hypothetical protein
VLEEAGVTDVAVVAVVGFEVTVELLEAPEADVVPEAEADFEADFEADVPLLEPVAVHPAC